MKHYTKTFIIATLFLLIWITGTTVFSQNEDKVVKMQLDSIVVEKSYKTIFFYNEYEKEILRIGYNWNDANNNWEESSKTEYIYDTNNNLIMQILDAEFKMEWIYSNNNNPIMLIEYFFYTDSNKWEITQTHEYIYDNNNKIRKQIEYENSLDDFKTEYTYDTNGNKIMYIGYLKNIKNNDWDVFFKYESVYDTNNNIREIHRWAKRTHTKEKEEYVYDTNGNQTKQISYSWKKNAWKARFKIEYENTKNQTKAISYYWEKNTWKKSGKLEYVYNNDGKETMNVCYYWNNDWFVLSKHENLYDSNGNPTMWVYYYRREYGSNDLELVNKTELIYDLSYSIENLILPDSYHYLFLENENINNLLMEIKYSNAESKKYYYSPYISNNQINK